MDSDDARTGFIIGAVLAGLLVAVMAWVADELGDISRDEHWCEQIAAANLGATLSQCVDEGTRVTVQP